MLVKYEYLQLEVFPDGRYKFIKHLAPSISLKPEQKLEINE